MEANKDLMWHYFNQRCERVQVAKSKEVQDAYTCVDLRGEYIGEVPYNKLAATFAECVKIAHDEIDSIARHSKTLLQEQIDLYFFNNPFD